MTAFFPAAAALAGALLTLATANPAMASDVGRLPASVQPVVATAVVPAPLSPVPPAAVPAAISTVPVEPKPVHPASLSELVAAHAKAEAPSVDQECIAAAVYFEARGEPIEGQLAVAQVVLNRAASGKYPASVCDVVKQRAQFSFVRRGRIPLIPRATQAWHKAVAITHVAFEHLARQIGSDVLWYHASYVAPSWGIRLTRVTQIGEHIFYSGTG